MPYINKQRRIDLAQGVAPTTVGELNFKITSICHDYLRDLGLNYSNLNGVIGVLECAKLELYRQVAAPYESKKKRLNGNISDLDSPTLEDVR